jgi:hypothetical protein
MTIFRFQPDRDDLLNVTRADACAKGITTSVRHCLSRGAV